MKSKVLKLLLVTAMILSQANLVPLVTYATEMEVGIDMEVEAEPETEVEIDTSLEDESVVEGEEALEEESVIADENLEADSEEDLVEDEVEKADEIEEADEDVEAIETRSARAPGSGLVQLEIRPVGTLPSGVTFEAARTALMNATTRYHTLWPPSVGGANHGSIGINGAFGRDALFLGEELRNGAPHYRVLIAGYEGLIPVEGATHSFTVNIGGVSRTINGQLVAVYYPFGNYAHGQGRSGFTANTEIQLLESADQFLPFEEGPLTKFSGETQVRSVSYYVNRGGVLHRVLTGNVANTLPAAPWGHIVGPAPAWMPENVAHYSFDGVFFYTNPRHIRPDGQNAVNATNPHFMYFQHLPLRALTNYTAADLDRFILSILTPAEQQRSALVGTGRYFIEAQERYGTNALIQLAFAIHESGRGLSSIAINNNNLFGKGAVDATPGESAHFFPTVRAGIMEHAGHWIGSYTNPADWRAAGPHLGNKGAGMNVWYATDPYWGEKIAGWAFRIDRDLGGRDLNNYTIGVHRAGTNVAVVNATGQTLYTAGRGFRNFPFLITGENATQHQIRTDSPVVNGVIDWRAPFNQATAVGFIPRTLNLVTVGGTNGTVPPTTPTPPTPPVVETGLELPGATTGNANFRTGPGTNHSSIRLLTRGTELTILGTSGTWTQVRVGNQTGWVSTQFVRALNIPGQTTENVHFRTGPGTNHTSIRVLPNGTTVTIIGERNDWTQVRVGNQEGWISSQFVARMNLPGRTSGRVNFRTGPGTGHGSIRLLPSGTNLTVLGESGSWSFVRVGNETGWISTQFVRRTSLAAQVNGRVNFRTGPGPANHSIRMLPSETTVTIVGERNGWFNIQVGNQNGWVNSTFISGMNLPGRSTGRVNFRTGPGVSNTSLRLLPSGTNFTILGMRNGWMNVRVGTQTGWVSGQLAQID